MGYTHYFPQNKPCPPEAWKQICEAFRAAIPLSGVWIVADSEEPNGEGPIINDAQIFFNGIGVDGYEPMSLEVDSVGEYTFCKTAEKPYDVLVTALLTLADKYAPGVWTITSDGKGDKWLEGVILAANACEGEAVSPVKAHAKQETT